MINHNRATRVRGRTAQRIKTMAWFCVVYVIVGVVWELVDMSRLTAAGPGIGLAVGLALAVLDESNIAGFTRSMSFTAAVVVKSVVYVGAIAVPIAMIGFITGFVRGLYLVDFIAWISSAEFALQLAILYAIHLSVLFFRHLNKLLGPGTLIRYVTGRYHKPRLERRVFMFLDLKASTALAETLGGETYYAFLNEFFRDLTDPILDRSAEIYQYVGDEVILTWPLESGLQDANCIRVFTEILAHVHSRRDYYIRQYGHVPEFKAGVHFGDVVTAEIGDIKKEISYFGDVLNTASRIQSKCNELGQQLIASEELVSELDLPEFIDPVSLGEVTLRGKAGATTLIGLYA